MKKKAYTFIAAALMTIGATGVAFAHGKGGDGKDGDNKDRRAEHEQHRAEMLTKYDANKDGKLDDTERAKLHADKVDEHFARLDTNKDGVLSKAEFAAFGPHGGPRK